MFDEQTLAAGVLANSGLSITNLSDSGNLVGRLSDQLGGLNDLLGLGSDLLLLGLDHLLEVLDLLLQGRLSSSSGFSRSLLDLLGNFSGRLRSERSLNGLGFLLNSLSLLFHSLDNFSALSDLGGDNSFIIFSLGLLGVLGLDDSLFGLDNSLKTADFFLNLSLLRLGLDDDFLFSELLDLLLSVGHSLGAGLDLLLSLDLDNSMGSLLSSELSSLTLNSLSGLSDSMSMSQSILFDLNDSVLVGVSVVSSSDSVDGGSLGLSGYLQRVGSLSLDFDVVSVVSGPGGVDGLDGRFNGGDLGGVSLDNLFVSGNLRLKARDLLLNGGLLLLGNFLKSFGESINSGLDVLKLRFSGGHQSFLLAEFLGPFGSLLLVFNFLGAVFLFGFLLCFDLLLINLLLVDNVGSFDTLGDISDGFLLRALGLLFSRLNLALDLSNHDLRFSDLFLRGNLLLSGSLDDFFSACDLTSNSSQFTSESLNIRSLSRSSNLGVDLLLLGSQFSQSFFAGGNCLLITCDDLSFMSDHFFELDSLSGTNFLNSGGLLSIFCGSFLFLDDLGGNISGRG